MPPSKSSSAASSSSPSFPAGLNMLDVRPVPPNIHNVEAYIGAHGTAHQHLGILADGRVVQLYPPVQRAMQACELCRKRKARCTGGQQCARCKKANVPCEYAQLDTHRRVKQTKSHNEIREDKRAARSVKTINNSPPVAALARPKRESTTRKRSTDDGAASDDGGSNSSTVGPLRAQPASPNGRNDNAGETDGVRYTSSIGGASNNPGFVGYREPSSTSHMPMPAPFQPYFTAPNPVSQRASWSAASGASYVTPSASYPDHPAHGGGGGSGSSTGAPHSDWSPSASSLTLRSPTPNASVASSHYHPGASLHGFDGREHHGMPQHHHHQYQQSPQLQHAHYQHGPSYYHQTRQSHPQAAHPYQYQQPRVSSQRNTLALYGGPPASVQQAYEAQSSPMQAPAQPPTPVSAQEAQAYDGVCERVESSLDMSKESNATAKAFSRRCADLVSPNSP